MGTWSSVECWEEKGTLSESGDLESGINCSITLRCARENRFLLITDIVGNQRSWPYLDGVYAYGWGTVMGEEGPTSSVDGQANVYQDAVITFKYSSSKTKDLIGESLEPTVQFQTLPWQPFVWPVYDDPEDAPVDFQQIKEGEAPGRQLRSMNIVRNWLQVSTPLHPDVLNLIGYVNHVAYYSALLGMTFPAETLLYCPPQTSRTIKSDGSSAANLTMKYSYQPNGWNTFWRAETGAYSRMWYRYLDGAGDPQHASYYNYPLGNFAALLF